MRKSGAKVCSIKFSILALSPLKSVKKTKMTIEAEETMKALAAKEGIFCGVSSGGSVAGALRLSAELENAVIVAIICDRGDRYLSSGIFGN